MPGDFGLENASFSLNSFLNVNDTHYVDWLGLVEVFRISIGDNMPMVIALVEYPHS